MKKLPKSARKFIRREKARISRKILDLKEQKRLIEKLYEDKRHLQSGNKSGN